MHFNLNHSLKQPRLSNVDYEILETKIPISSELNNDYIFQNSMNENEMNFQYLDHLEVEFMDSNVKLKKQYSVLKKILQKNPAVMKRKLLT